MTLFSSRSIAVAVVTLLCLQSQAVHCHENRMPPTGYVAGEQHPQIHHAIKALEAAKAYMEAAPHDFCGHRVTALAESNLALNELGLAIICDKRRERSGGSAIEMPDTSPIHSSASRAADRHPLIRQAISALEAAKRDLQSADHDYCGHRVDALDAVNRALPQLRLALDCDKD
jgi:hypothetical protein